MPVELGTRSYQVHVGTALLDQLDALIPPTPQAESVALISDSNVDPLWGDQAEKALLPRGRVHRFTFKAGEASKSLETASVLLGELAGARVRRHDLLVVLGGGVAGDLGAFVGSVYQRGMSVVQVPTTLLAQVDAAIGGKTGVNLAQGKNLAGTFHQPLVVVSDAAALSTLPEREYLAGLAEVAKYGFCFDPSLLDLLQSRRDAVLARDPGVVEELVAASTAIKAEVVSSDELDLADRRALLNYGHTLGHALEAAAMYEGWLHGEAVSVGMVFAARLSAELGFLEPAEAQRHRALLASLGLPVAAPGLGFEELAGLWSIDKKYRGGLRWVLLRSAGDAFMASGIGDASLERALGEVAAQ